MKSYEYIFSGKRFLSLYGEYKKRISSTPINRNWLTFLVRIYKPQMTTDMSRLSKYINLLVAEERTPALFGMGLCCSSVKFYVVWFCFVCLSSVPCTVPNVSGVSWLALRASLSFIYRYKCIINYYDKLSKLQTNITFEQIRISISVEYLIDFCYLYVII